LTEITFDMSEVAKLAADVGRVAPAMVAPLAGVLTKSSTAIRQDLRKGSAGHPRFPSFPGTITFDIRGLSSEIGPEKRGAGNLANILYFGTVNNGAVLEHPTGALNRERPKFETALATAIEAGLRKGLGA
jgi:hypothetical protein